MPAVFRRAGARREPRLTGIKAPARPPGVPPKLTNPNTPHCMFHLYLYSPRYLPRMPEEARHP
jgi:hypothetical protein